MAPSRSQLLRTATDCVNRLSNGRSDNIVAIRNAKCRHEVGPPCMGVPAPLSNEEYGAWWDSFVPRVWPNGMEVWLDNNREPVVDVHNRHVVLYCKSRAESHKGIYEGSYVFNITISEDGEKVDDIVEFLDSKSALEYSTKALGLP
ncbi:hypothetical protein H2200_008746 [Cladophialophora chaetospira]|uniref:Uncharacterized protein n=1 Tax=Cladophialophora chaetospira TaxID=386627 RepID=A0AA38X4L5_9EURO|nr:hypothetical protein H2200_008746 [Cladophialophora chaetospira]